MAASPYRYSFSLKSALWAINLPSARQKIEPPNDVLAEHLSDSSMTHEAMLFGSATLSWHFFPNGQTSNPLTVEKVGFGSMLNGLT
jgi:hypothetical protein